MTMSRSRCIAPHDRIDQVINEVENIVVEGATYTAGCGIDITGTVITAAIDNTSIICADGVLSAVAASDLTAGCGIDITGGEVSVAHDASLDCTGGVLSVVSQDLFSSLVVSGQTTVTANSPTTALTLVAGTNITIATDNTAKSVTINSSGGGAPTAGTYIDVSGSTVSVDLTEVSGYNGATTQLLGHISGTFQLKTVAEWLNTLSGYASGSDQSIGHDAGGATEWQNDGVC